MDPAMSNCPHLARGVGFMSAPDLASLVSVPKCDICSSGPNGLWLCLYPECYMLGCSEGRDHSTVHNHKNEEHCLQMNIDSRRIWCYKCELEVEVRKDVSQKFGALIPPDGVQTVVPNQQHEPNPNRSLTPRGLVGLSNLGNTCYMNAALQCLLNTPALADFFLECPALVTNAEKNNLSKNLQKLVEDVWAKQNGSSKSFISPTGVLYAMKTAFPMFRGFQQHDSQEFLRCLMDVLHEELMEPIVVLDDNDMDSVSEVGSHVSDVEPEEYETADSGVSEQSSLCSNEGEKMMNQSRKRKVDETQNLAGDGLTMKEDGNRKREKESDSLGGDTGVSSCNSEVANPCEVELEFLDAASDVVSNHSGSPPLSSSPRSVCRFSQRNPSIHIPVIHKRFAVIYRSVISDIFDGKLVSSVQCLTCDRVSKTTEAFQDLSLPIPTQESLASVRNQPTSTAAANEEGWMSWLYTWMSGWFYGPNITLIDCLSYFFSADELKGDNMYSCERCKKLRNGLKYSRVTILPDTLCIHLKRFRHEFAFSSKISTRVTFPLVDLDMSPWLHKDSISKVSSYDLTGVICHHGNAGGGHYTAYALNPLDQEWYEFDDSNVTKVDPAAVMNSEAYVLFYRKNNAQNEPIRLEMQMLLAKDREQPGLIQFYVSRQWLNKFDNFGEPGPIDNSDFLCPHGGVLPLKTSYVYELCVSLPQSVYELLRQQYGGGPSCTRLYECTQCRQELDTLTKQKRYELEEFKNLHAEFQGQESHTAIFCLSSSWFKLWEGFVTNRTRDPPGPIDNRNIITSVSGNPPGMSSTQTLRTSSDYLQISLEIWQLFHSIYGGGPEVVLKPNGIVYVSPVANRNATNRNLSRATSWASAPRPFGGVMTRSKARSISDELNNQEVEDPDL